MRIQNRGTRLVVAMLILVPCALTLASAVKPELAARRTINLPGHSAQAPYSDAVLVGKTLYIAGSIGFEPQTRKLPAKIEDEVKLVLDHMKAVLADAGMTMDDVVFVQVFCPDVATLYDPFNFVYRAYFAKDLPARAFLGSGPLIGGGHFEVMAVAVKAK